mmetsp:Transcript_3680/g.13226  ORF Transcript_3680/g.13226 Transcript_3680/m.13226 type:complete len:161 (+) Transcript_3680:1010-1492(+)|eukprot:scaffold5708_cov378-Prasinococcus_capsulatus_cf.AAC.8
MSTWVPRLELGAWYVLANAFSYRYAIYTGPRPDPFIAPYAHHHYSSKGALDVLSMRSALRTLHGCHDLSAFVKLEQHRGERQLRRQRRRAEALTASETLPPVMQPQEGHNTTVLATECWQSGPFVFIEVQANRFRRGIPTHSMQRAYYLVPRRRLVHNLR